MRAALLAVVVIVFCCNNLPRAVATSGAASVPIPCEQVRNMLYLRVSVNGSRPLWMNLDTGASHSVVDPGPAKALGLVQVATGQASGTGRGQSAQFGRVEGITLQIGSSVLHSQSILTLSTSFLASQLGHVTDGIVGSNLFYNYVVAVDYAHRQLVLKNPAFWKPDRAGTAIPIELSSNIPFIAATITLPNGGNAKGIFLIDSGQIGAPLSLNEAFLKAHPELLTQPAILPPPSDAVGGSFSYKITRVPALTIGGFVLKDPITVLPLHAAGIDGDPNVAGVIGADALSRFNVVYDYPHRKMYLSPNSQFSQPFENDMSGLRLTAQPPEFKRFQVSGITTPSPASEAGIRDGDVISAMDGRPAIALTLAQVQESLERFGEARHVTIQRGGQTFDVTLRLRRLI